MHGVTTPAGFVDLCNTLYGSYVDADVLWSHVSKLSPGPSDVHVMSADEKRKKFEHNVARTSNVVGLAAGLAGTGAAVSSYRETKRTKQPGKATGFVARKTGLSGKSTGRLAIAGAGAASALQFGNIVGDAVTTRVLARSAQKEEARKVYTPNLQRIVRGRKKVMREVQQATIEPERLAPGSVRPNVPPSAPGPLSEGQRAAMGTGASVRAGADQLLSSRSGKVAVGAAAAGTYGVGRRQGRKKGIVEGYYAKRDVEIQGTFSKLDEEKRRAYGWASVVSLNGEPVIDRQGDFITLDDIEEAAYTYVRKSRVTGRMHERTADDQPRRAGELIESVVFTKDKCEAMGLPTSFSGKWWMGVQIDPEDEEAWEKVKKREWTGFSIHGKGLRKDVSYDEVMAGHR